MRCATSCVESLVSFFFLIPFPFFFLLPTKTQQTVLITVQLKSTDYCHMWAVRVRSCRLLRVRVPPGWLTSWRAWWCVVVVDVALASLLGASVILLILYLCLPFLHLWRWNRWSRSLTCANGLRFPFPPTFCYESQVLIRFRLVSISFHLSLSHSLAFVSPTMKRNVAAVVVVYTVWFGLACHASANRAIDISQASSPSHPQKNLSLVSS